MKNQEYFWPFLHITINETASINWIELVNCVLAIAALLGGAWCFVQIRKLKEKRLDAIFSFLTRLSIRLKLLSSSLEKYHGYILDALCIPTKRYDIEEADDNSYSKKIVDLFLQNSQETLNFLLNSDNQIPLQRGWVDKYNQLIEFLDVYVKTEDKDFYIWDDDLEKKKESFYNKHVKNMKDMLREIYEQQQILEQKLTSKKIMGKTKNN